MSTRVSDAQLIESYSKLGNVWKVAGCVGMSGQQVHVRLSRIGAIAPVNVFTEKDREHLRHNYSKHKNSGTLQALADEMGRTKQFICRQAKKLGLTNQKAPRPYIEKPGSNPYAKQHARVRSLRGTPQRCDVCGEIDPRKWYDWANLTGDYDNPDDYKRMCRKCHRAHDKSRPMRAHPRSADRDRGHADE